MVVSQNKGTPKKGTPNFGKHPFGLIHMGDEH